MQFGNFAQAELERSRLFARACIQILGADGMAGADPAANAVADLYRDPQFTARDRRAPGPPPVRPVGAADQAMDLDNDDDDDDDKNSLY